MTRKEALLFIRFLKNINEYKEFNKKVIKGTKFYTYGQKEIIKNHYPNITIYFLETYEINSILKVFYKEHYPEMLYGWNVFKIDNNYSLW